MGLLNIDNLEVGMVLASDVKDRNGRMLLGAGAELTQKHMTVFRTWGVIDVDIAGIDYVQEESSVPAEMDPAEVAAAEEEIRPRFFYSGTDHPALKELLTLAAVRKVQNGVL